MLWIFAETFKKKDIGKKPSSPSPQFSPEREVRASWREVSSNLFQILKGKSRFERTEGGGHGPISAPIEQKAIFPMPPKSLLNIGLGRRSVALGCLPNQPVPTSDGLKVGAAIFYFNGNETIFRKTHLQGFSPGGGFIGKKPLSPLSEPGAVDSGICASSLRAPARNAG